MFHTAATIMNVVLVVIIGVCLSPLEVQGFNPVPSSRRSNSRTSIPLSTSASIMRMTSSDGFQDRTSINNKENNLISKGVVTTTADDVVIDTKKSSPLPKMSIAIPFLARPTVLQQELAGDFGFDPLHFAKDRTTLYYYREMEIKHARLAMLAAAGWPLSELLDRPIANYFNIPSLLDDMDRVPSVLNGHLDTVRPEFWGFCVGLTAAIDNYQTYKSRQAGDNDQNQYTPGDLGWDPLQWTSVASGEHKKAQLQLAEIQNGRLAMLGVTGFAVQEYWNGMAVIHETPFFFQPISETVEVALKALLSE